MKFFIIEREKLRGLFHIITDDRQHNKCCLYVDHHTNGFQSADTKLHLEHSDELVLRRGIPRGSHT